MNYRQRKSSLTFAFLVVAATLSVLNLNSNSARRSIAPFGSDYQQQPVGEPAHTIQEPSSTGFENSTANLIAYMPAANQSFPVNAKASPTPVNQPKDTSRWIHVEEFSEGMATWRISFAEILMVARKLNATVVEPCIGDGRLRSCRDASYRLGQIYDLERLRQYHAKIVSYADYQAMLAAHSPLIVTMCHQVPTGSPSPLMVCGHGVQNMYQAPSNHLLDQALHHTNGTTVIQIKYYRMGGFRTTKVGRNRLVLPRFIEPTIAEYFDFENQHYDAVDSVLQFMGIANNSDYDVIHWRAELPNLYYDDCATKILQAREAIGSNTTVLMSSINRQAALQWHHPYRQHQAIASLSRLEDAGMRKMDQAFRNGLAVALADKVVIAVWDQIIALKAKRFVTCTKSCRQKNAACVACNYLGNYAQMAVGLRQSHGKSSDECWPT